MTELTATVLKLDTPTFNGRVYPADLFKDLDGKPLPLLDARGPSRSITEWPIVGDARVHRKDDTLVANISVSARAKHVFKLDHARLGAEFTTCGVGTIAEDGTVTDFQLTGISICHKPVDPTLSPIPFNKDTVWTTDVHSSPPWDLTSAAVAMHDFREGALAAGYTTAIDPDPSILRVWLIPSPVHALPPSCQDVVALFEDAGFSVFNTGDDWCRWDVFMFKGHQWIVLSFVLQRPTAAQDAAFDAMYS